MTTDEKIADLQRQIDELKAARPKQVLTQRERERLDGWHARSEKMRLEREAEENKKAAEKLEQRTKLAFPGLRFDPSATARSSYSAPGNFGPKAGPDADRKRREQERRDREENERLTRERQKAQAEVEEREGSFERWRKSSGWSSGPGKF